MTARTTQPRLSKGPLGERGRRLQERLGVVPLAAITRRGAVPVWLRASWSCPLAAAKAASQPANCRRHEGWSRSPSPRTRWGTRSLICARFQPDWGKPNVRLIGGREETGASRLFRAARGASRLPDYQLSPDPGPRAGSVGHGCRYRARLTARSRATQLRRRGGRARTPPDAPSSARPMIIGADARAGRGARLSVARATGRRPAPARLMLALLRRCPFEGELHRLDRL